MSYPPDAREYSGKKVIIFTLIGLVVFTILMGVGTWGFAKVLTPYLQRMNRAKGIPPPTTEENAPSLPSSN